MCRRRCCQLITGACAGAASRPRAPSTRQAALPSASFAIIMCLGPARFLLDHMSSRPRHLRASGFVRHKVSSERRPVRARGRAAGSCLFLPPTSFLPAAPVTHGLSRRTHLARSAVHVPAGAARLCGCSASPSMYTSPPTYSAGVPGMLKGYENLKPSNERESMAAAIRATPLST